MIDDLVLPLRSSLAPNLADDLFIGVIGGASKRLEATIKRVSIIHPPSIVALFLTY